MRRYVSSMSYVARTGRNGASGTTPSEMLSVTIGVTLIELLVVLVLLGLLSGVVGLTLGSTPRVPALDPVTASVLAARDSALRAGHPVTISVVVQGSAHRATAFPDGRVLSDAPLDIDPLSGSASLPSVVDANAIGNAPR